MPSAADVVELALRGGFDLAGIAPFEALHDPAIEEWLARGFHGEMHYLAHHAGFRREPRRLFKAAESVLAVAVEYGDSGANPTDARLGNVSRYALGHDYHQVLKERLRDVELSIRARYPGLRTRSFVDAGPFNEKRAAVLAGLGFVGKHTNLIRQGRGSWFFLGMMLLGAPLAPTAPRAKDRCGRCTRCIDVCPTQAIVAPYVLDARRCISYLTIELAGPIPREFRAAIGNRIFGCDDCQTVCPWNRFARRADLGAFAPRPGIQGRSLTDWLHFSPADFDATFHDLPVRRIGFTSFIRNVLIAAGNSGDPKLVIEVERWIGDPLPVLRISAAWALARLDAERAQIVLRGRQVVESDSAVQEEITLSLDDCAAR